MVIKVWRRPVIVVSRRRQFFRIAPKMTEGILMIVTRELYSEIDGRLYGDAVQALKSGVISVVEVFKLRVCLTRSSRCCGLGISEDTIIGQSLFKF